MEVLYAGKFLTQSLKHITLLGRLGPAQHRRGTEHGYDRDKRKESPHLLPINYPNLLCFVLSSAARLKTGMGNFETLMVPSPDNLVSRLSQESANPFHYPLRVAPLAHFARQNRLLVREYDKKAFGQG